MNENQLRSWRPRQPSAGLKAAIFNGLNGQTEPAPTSTQWLWGGLVPTMACALLTLAAINHNGESFGPPPGPGIILSTQGCVVAESDNERSVQNHLAAVTFDWTNRSVFKSSIHFTPSTNLSN